MSSSQVKAQHAYYSRKASYYDDFASTFGDALLDLVVEIGRLHVVPALEKTVAGMSRMARLDVIVSDSNKFRLVRWLICSTKGLIDWLGVWQTPSCEPAKRKVLKRCQGSCVFYSDAVFENLDIVKLKLPAVIMMNTLDARRSHLERYNTNDYLMVIKPS